jgi:CHAT domain
MDSAVLKLCISGSPGAYRVSAEVNGSQASDDLGALPGDLKESLAPLQEAILRTTESLRDQAQDRGPAPPPRPAAGGVAAVRGFSFGNGADSRGIQEIGARLFDCVFQPEIYELYKDHLEAARRGNAELRVKLCVEAQELTYVPWETMFDKRRLFHLSCSQTTPFARVATMQEFDLHIYDELPLRILCMVSAPNDFVGTPYELQTDVEQAGLDHALEPLKNSNQVKLCWTASGTRRELMTRIVRGDNGKKWDVFLFIGHGLEGSLVFEEDGGPGHELVSADVLRDLLDAPNGPKLIILNSCKGAKKLGDRLASTAETLVRGGGIAAVVAMQFDISDMMGTAFSPSFFSKIMLGVSIQQAMTLTRVDLKGMGFTEWISPVLYMQSRDGRVLKEGGPATTERG